MDRFDSKESSDRKLAPEVIPLKDWEVSSKEIDVLSKCELRKNSKEVTRKKNVRERKEKERKRMKDRNFSNNLRLHFH